LDRPGGIRPSRHWRLARRIIEKWAVRFALWFDRHRTLSDASRNFGAALRLFGLERFRDGHLPVVEAALCGQSVLVVSPTGFGKTLCFQLPAILRPGVSVVVSPLKALMGEQVSALLRRKIPSTFINSDLDSVEKRVRYQLLVNKSLKLLYAPERSSQSPRLTSGSRIHGHCRTGDAKTNFGVPWSERCPSFCPWCRSTQHLASPLGGASQ
jgi:DEAD/DEAH box helicase